VEPEKLTMEAGGARKGNFSGISQRSFQRARKPGRKKEGGEPPKTPMNAEKRERRMGASW
jgi:hypothetical protein